MGNRYWGPRTKEQWPWHDVSVAKRLLQATAAALVCVSDTHPTRAGWLTDLECKEAEPLQAPRAQQVPQKQLMLQP